MDFNKVLAQTAPRKGPQSAIDRLLDTLESEVREEVLDALDSDLQAAHLGRALTKLAHFHKVIGQRSSIDGQAVQTWRAKQVTP